MDAWNTSFLLGWSILRCYASFRESKSSYNRVVCHPLILRHTHDAWSTYPLNQSNHWFPLMRPAIKPLFLKEGYIRAGRRLSSPEPIWGCYDVDEAYFRFWSAIMTHGYPNSNGNLRTFQTYPWNIPQTPNQQFMKEFLSFGGERGSLGYAPGVCWGSLRRKEFLHPKNGPNSWRSPQNPKTLGGSPVRSLQRSIYHGYLDVPGI